MVTGVDDERGGFGGAVARCFLGGFSPADAFSVLLGAAGRAFPRLGETVLLCKRESVGATTLPVE